MIGKALRTLREAKGLGLQDAAKIMGIGKATISLHENERRLPSKTHLEKYADCYGVTIGTLLYFVYCCQGMQGNSITDTIDTILENKDFLIKQLDK